MTLPSVRMADPRERPSPRARLLWSLAAALLWVPLLVAAIVLFVFSPWPTWLHVLLVAVAAVGCAVDVGVVPQWRYRVHRWEISDTAVYTLTGWFDQERRIAPISRIQTVDTERGPLERLLGLATVTVTTASSAGAVRIPALDLAVADTVTARLTEITAAAREDAT